MSTQKQDWICYYHYKVTCNHFKEMWLHYEVIKCIGGYIIYFEQVK